ncbi:MAG: hypothetical protein WBA93_17100 [Microcoleaceae cyanobacterium]
MIPNIERHAALLLRNAKANATSVLLHILGDWEVERWGGRKKIFNTPILTVKTFSYTTGRA